MIELGRTPGEAVEGEQLKLIAPPTIAHRFLPPLLAAFQAEEPGVRVVFEIGITADVVAKMADGMFDLGITDAQLHHPSVVFETFRRGTAHAVMQANDPLTSQSEIAPADLHHRPFIALTRRFSARTAIDSIFRDAGVEPKVVVEAATSAIAYELVRNGAGVTLLNPFPIAFRGDVDIAIRPFTPKVTFETSFVLSTATPATSAARRFMTFIRRHQAEDGYSSPIR